MAETGLVENSSDSSSTSTGKQAPASETTPTSGHHSASSESLKAKHPADEMDEESPLVSSHDRRGVPSANDTHSNEDSEFSSPPPDDGSSGSEQVYLDERMPPPYGMMSPSVLPLVDGYMSPRAPVVIMPAIQSEGFSSDKDLNESPPQGAELRKQLVVQLEYYFSKENLSSDKYLLSQMDGDHYVPIQIVAGFNQVKRLTSDVNIIREAVKESSCLQLDEVGGKVRAVPEKRCVLILREIPKDTPEKDITALFASEKCPNYTTCEFADNDCWYVTFESEEDTRKAHQYLREEVREFLGHPIRARIKGTTVQRSSGMPKKTRNVSYPMPQPVYNGSPQVPFYPQPPGVVPWPPAASPNYFENVPVPAVSSGSNYMQFVGNPAQPAFAGPPNRGFANVPAAMYVSEGEPPHIRGRTVASGSRGGSHMDRGHSPRPLPNGDAHTERDRIPERGSGGGGERGRGSRGDHYGGGGRYRNRGDDDQNKKIPPRLNKTRRPNGGGGTGDSGDRGQMTSRQQAKPQNKFELAQSNFPPLPTSSEGGGVTTPAPAFPTVTQSQSHMISDEASRPTASDIVKGKHLQTLRDSALPSTAVAISPTVSQQPQSNATNPSTASTALTSSPNVVTPSSAASIVSNAVTSTSASTDKRPVASAPPIQSQHAGPTSSTTPHPPQDQTSSTPSNTTGSSNNGANKSATPTSTAANTVNNSTSSSGNSSNSNNSSNDRGTGANEISSTGPPTSSSAPLTMAQTVATSVSQVVSSSSTAAGGYHPSAKSSQAPPTSTSTATPTVAAVVSSSSNSLASTVAPPTSVSSAPVSSNHSSSTHQPQTLQQTASQVVAMNRPPAAPSAGPSVGGGAGGGAHHQNNSTGVRPSPSQAKAQRPDGKVMSRDSKPYNNGGNKGGSRYSSDRDYSQNRQNYYRNQQVSKSDNSYRPSPSSNGGRGRFRDRDRDRERERDNRRPGMNNRSQQLKPSPKTAKKNSAPQAPPPPPSSTTPTPQGDTKPTTSSEPTNSNSSATNNNTNTATSGTAAGASKTEKLSYAQMAQKKASAPPPLPKAITTGANQSTSTSTATVSQATTPPGTTSSTGSGSSQQPAATKTASAPTSPQQSQSTAGPVSNGAVPSSSSAGALAKQSNSMKAGKTGFSGSSGQLSTPGHAALTASKSAPASPQKEKPAEAVKSS